MKKLLIFCVFLTICTTLSGAEAFWRKKQTGACQILDKVSPAWDMGAALIPSSRVEGDGKTALVEINADWEFAYFRDRMSGDIDLNLSVKDTIFTSSTDLDLPSQAAKIAVDAGWTWRYENGLALQARFAPGIYSDMSELGPSAFYFPISGALLRSFGPSISGIAGLEFRPKFETPLMPIFGVEWEINEALRLEALLPESRFVCFINSHWNTYLGWDWNNTTYTLDDSRSKITLEDFRYYWGVSHSLSDQVRLTAELGRSVNRSIEFDEGRDNDADIKNASLFRIGITGPF